MSGHKEGKGLEEENLELNVNEFHLLEPFSLWSFLMCSAKARIFLSFH